MHSMHHTPLQVRRREKSFVGNNQEKDEDLALFQDMEKREREAAHEPVSLSLDRGALSIAPPKSNAEDILASTEGDKHDYDWLLTPPPTSFLSSLDQAGGRNGSLLARSAVVKSTDKAKRGSCGSDPYARADESPTPASRRSCVIQEPEHAGAGSISSSKSSQKLHSAGNRPATSLSSRPVARCLTPTKSAAPGANVCASTQTGRVAAPSNHSVSSSRAAISSRRPASTSVVQNSSTAPVRPSAVNKTSSVLSKSVTSMHHPSSASIKARQPSVAPIGQDSTSNLRVPAAGRPLSNPRGSMSLRANTTSAKKGQPHEADAGVKNRRLSGSHLQATVRGGFSDSFSMDKSMSMVRNGVPHNAASIARSSDASSKKAADKTVSLRKPLSTQEKIAVASSDTQAKRSIKSAACGGEIRSIARESSGFGRNLSRTSLDMAIRHMDIQGSASRGVKPSMSKVPTSSRYGVRARDGKGNAGGQSQSVIPITSSPMASSSAASSERSMSIMMDQDTGEPGDETCSKVGREASSERGLDQAMALYNERKVSHWLGSPDGGAVDERDDAPDDAMQNFEHELASLSGPESGIIDCDEDFMLDTMY